MKNVAIIYGIAWLILLAVYIASLFSKNKSRLVSKEPWYIYAIIIGFAPIVVLIIPYIIWKSAKDDKEIRVRNEEYERRKREEEDKINRANDRFNAAQKSAVNECGSDYIAIAQALHSSVRKKEYRKLSDVLDKIVLLRGAKLKVHECHQNGLGEESRVALSGHSPEEDVFESISFEESTMGAWQAYLLHQLWHSLPLWWHANYSIRDYLFAKKDIQYVRHIRQDRVFPDIESFVSSPEIYFLDGRYYVACCYWTDFGGVLKEYVEFSFINGKLTDFVCFRTETLFEYECGINF